MVSESQAFVQKHSHLPSESLKSSHSVRILFCAFSLNDDIFMNNLVETRIGRQMLIHIFDGKYLPKYGNASM